MIGLQAPSQILNGDERLQVERDARPGVYSEGKLIQDGAPTQFTIRATIQPLNDRDLLLVPEGDRFKEQYWLYTSDDLRDNDRVIRQGANFAVQGTAEWGSYRRAKITRMDVGPRA